VIEHLIQLLDWGNANIIKFNWCHIKMQVLTLADIIHGEGITIRQGMMSFRSGEVLGSRYEWAREDPCSSDWAMW
jgi:hypothetical protein